MALTDAPVTSPGDPDDASAPTRTVDLIEPGAGGNVVADELIAEHESLAQGLARRYAGRPELSTDDLYQVARAGLVAAARRFDPGRGLPFVAFAAPTITGELRRYIRDTRWVVRVPRRLQERALEAQACRERLTASMQRSPTDLDIAESIGSDGKTVRSALAALGHLASDPLVDEVHGRSGSSDDDARDLVERRLMVDQCLHLLTERERMILRWYYYDEFTQREIAERLGISQVGVSKAMQRCFVRLREQMGDLEEG